MTQALKNGISSAIISVVIYLYFTHIARLWLDHTNLDPLLINVFIVPFVLGIISFAIMFGTTFQKIFWFLIAPIIPLIILGQNGDPAKPGLQWLVIEGIMLLYCIGGLLMGLIFFILRKIKSKA